jgi:outer membrane protein OmpA-like peptidoglycan-associated protein
MKKLALALLLLCCRAHGQNNQLNSQVISPRFVVNFEFNSYQLNAEAKRHLDSLVYLIQHETYAVQKIEITGYTDSISSDEYNNVLSLKRANAVGDYFKTHGIADTLIKTISGYGKRKPVNNNSDSLQRLANRRVEIAFQLLIPEQKPQKNIAVAPSSTVHSAPLYVADTSSVPKIDISKAEVGDIIELKEINFDPGRHYLMKQAKKNLQLLVNTMLINKTLRIEIRGHVCCMPADVDDDWDLDSGERDLSVERAKIIYNYLVMSGVDRGRMTYVGLGSKFPKVEEFTDEDKLQNRRVEVRILAK